MSITPVASFGPRAEPQQRQEKPEKDAMEKIIEGLQIANGVLGIGTNISQIQHNNAATDALDREKNGLLSAEKEQQGMVGGLSPVDKNTPGATSFKISDNSDQGYHEQAYIKAPQRATPLGQYVKTTGPEGGPVMKWAERGGPDVPAYVEPKAPKERSITNVREDINGDLYGFDSSGKGKKLDAGDAKFGKQPGAPGKTYSELVLKVETPRGRPDVQNAQKNLLAIGNAKELLSQYPDLNQMPVQQANLLNAELSKISSGGVGSEHGQKSLEASTLASNWQSLKARVGGEPTPAELGGFLKENAKYLDGLEGVANDTVAKYQKAIYGAYKSRLTPEEDAAFKQEYAHIFKEKGQPQAAPQVGGDGMALGAPAGGKIELPAHPQDNVAVKWANENRLSKDPAKADKALKILQANGGG